MARISRRDMLQSGALASVFAASGGAVLARGRRGGRLRAALSGGTGQDGWDFRKVPGLFMRAAGQGAVFEGLTEIGPDGALRGELAESWSSDAQAVTWHFRLRPDVVFHDGRPFNSADVLASFEAVHGHVAPLEQVIAIETPTPATLRIVLAQPNPSFPFELAHPQMMIQPAGALGQGIGTGLYARQHFAPGARFLGARVAAHWKGDSAGFVDEVELLALNSQREQRAALKAGVVDLASDIPEPALPQMRGLRVQGRVAVTTQVQTPVVIDTTRDVDNARFTQRWWLA